MKPIISVVIGTYNQRENLHKVLESLLEQTLSSDLYEIIVVDSSSTDGTAEMVKPFILQEKISYFCQENLGRPGARNRGIKEAKGEIILLTDADMIAHPELLEEHLLFHNHFHNAIAEGLTYNLKSLEGDIKNPKNIEPYIKQKLKPLQKIKWAYFLTGNLSIPKQVIEAEGAFDMRFRGYGWEDVELGYRLSKKKVPIYYLPSAKNYHYHIVSSKDMDQRKYHMGQSASIFYKKHPNLEVKMFLGLNFLAVLLYKMIDRSTALQNLIFHRHLKSDFWTYVWEEYLYRKGFFEKISER